MDYAKLHNIVMKKIDHRAFFTSLGLVVAGEPDADGWIEASGCMWSGGKIHVNLNSGKWKEQFTGQSGNIYQLVIRTQNLEESDKIGALKVLCQFTQTKFPEEPVVPDVDGSTPVSTETLSRIARAFVSTLPIRLKQRTGINEDTVKKYRLGWIKKEHTKEKSGHYFIPIPNGNGEIRSARSINEDMQARWMTRIPGDNKLEVGQKLYGLDELLIQNWKTVIICNGEFDRLILMQERQSDDVGVLCAIDGWSPGWNHYLAGRNVVICYAYDSRSQSVVQSMVAPTIEKARSEHGLASLKVVKLPGAGTPEDCRVYQWMKSGRTWGNLQSLIEKTREYALPGVGDANADAAILTSFAQIDDPVYADRRVRVPLAITGETSVVFDAPLQFEVSYCSWIEREKCSLCVDRKFVIPVGSEAHIEACGSTKAQVDKICQNICCQFGQRPKIKQIEKGTFRELIASQYHSRLIERPPDEVTGEDQNRIDGRKEVKVERRVIIKIPSGRSEPIEPRGYIATGTIRTHPKNSTRTMSIESLEPIPEPHETFDYKMHIDDLRFLQGLGWKEIIKDLIESRTRIFGCDEIILLTMLTYCSPLHIHFNGEFNVRGWVTCALIGDTGIGKSVTFEKLSEMIGVGDIFSCLTGRRTGLTYSVVKNDSFWKCQAGLHPQNTRKILCIEEAQVMEKAEIASMGIAMDKGELNVHTVARGSYESKTRVIFNCNPPRGKTMANYRFGCLAIADLFIPAFVRRLDVAAFIRRQDNDDLYNKRTDESIEPKISPDVLRTLIYYAWSLTPERIVFSEETTMAILEQAKIVSKKYGHPDEVPLVYPPDVRKTIARLAAAWAVLDVSTNPSGPSMSQVVVKTEHVTNVIALMENLYASQNCALDKYSETCMRQRTLEDYPAIEQEFKRRVEGVGMQSAITGNSYFARLISVLMKGITYQIQGLKSLIGCSDGWIEEACRFLESYHLAQSKKGFVNSTPKLTRFMKRFEDENPIHSGYINVAAHEMEKPKEFE